jgi:GNAT superfamily N-acetyltransferase
MDFKITELRTTKDRLRFVKSQWNFHKDDKFWVPPVVADRMKLLNTEKNPFFKHSEIQLFIAEREGKVVGRIAAIINRNHNTTHNDKVGFWGFFESINDRSVSDALFNEAGKWLKDRGCDSMIGPENPSMNDEIGMLFEGYDSSPVILMTYNPPYYNQLCESYGMTKAKDVFAYLLDSAAFLTDKITRMQQVIRDRYKVTFRQFDMKNKEQFRKDVQTLKDIYNAAWQPNWGFVKWTNEEFDFIAQDLKMTADERLAVIMYVDDKIAGFGLALPDLNIVLKYNKSGSMIGAIWHLMTKKKKINLCRIVALGVLPEFQNKGLDVVLYYELGSRGMNCGYIYGEASWILEDNVMMNRGLTQTMHAELYKKYRLYEMHL